MKTVLEIGKAAVKAKRVLATVSSEMKNRALCIIAQELKKNAGAILQANDIDIADGKRAGLSEAMTDRLTLSEPRIDGICDGVLQLCAMADPVGRVLSEDIKQNGLKIQKVTVPIGVIAVIFEARPNVAVDSAALCLKSGNAVILRGGREAINSNRALCDIMRGAIARAGLPEDCIQLVEDTGHESANELMKLNGYVDVLIPRGGRGLIKAVVQNASVPVIETGAGTCHIYIDRDADLEMAAKIVDNAKTSRPSVCNACECILVHADIAQKFLPMVKALLDAHSVEIRADESASAILKDSIPASDSDWGREYNDYILACRVVDSVSDAVEHIYRYGTSHSEAIVTRNEETAKYFVDNIDAAAVYVNASTRFTDGGEFGLGAEIGISTQKLHARGPLGLNELTSYKYKIFGNGQIRQ
ncbi:MAG: glutamate-5-semialdehyde dehydrogenase [Oscillospiraceae bacterium]